MSVDKLTTRKRKASKLNQAGRRVASHSEALFRLSVGEALRKGIDEFERKWNYDGGWNPCHYNVRLPKPTSDSQ